MIAQVRACACRMVAVASCSQVSGGGGQDGAIGIPLLQAIAHQLCDLEHPAATSRLLLRLKPLPERCCCKLQRCRQSWMQRDDADEQRLRDSQHISDREACTSTRQFSPMDAVAVLVGTPDLETIYNSLPSAPSAIREQQNMMICAWRVPQHV